MGRNPEVMRMVKRQLNRKNPPDTKALYGRAMHIDPSIRELSVRQFHARYPLQVKRQRARKQTADDDQADTENRKTDRRTGGRPSGRSSGRLEPRREPPRAAVKKALLAFAREVVAAEDKASVIPLIEERLPMYIERLAGLLES